MFEVIWSAYEHHITSNFLKAVRPHHFKSLKGPFLSTLIHIQLLLHQLVGQKEKNISNIFRKETRMERKRISTQNFRTFPGQNL